MSIRKMLAQIPARRIVDSYTRWQIFKAKLFGAPIYGANPDKPLAYQLNGTIYLMKKGDHGST